MTHDLVVAVKLDKIHDQINSSNSSAHAGFKNSHISISCAAFYGYALRQNDLLHKIQLSQKYIHAKHTK